MAVLTEEGFNRPGFDELVSDQATRAKQLFGDTIDTSEQSVMGKFIRLLCFDLDAAYQELEKCYYARFPNTASGQSLDRLVAFAAISRNPATSACHNVKFTGTPETEIPAGFLVSTANEIIFHTVNTLTIGEDSTVSGMVEANEPGTAGNVAVGTINTIVNPTANISAVTHIGIEEYGMDIESDADLRKRFSDTLAGGGSSTFSSIKAEILRIPNVNSVIVVENDTDETVGELPPHSFCCYVDAPESQNQLIAEAIFSKKPIGIACVGSMSATVLDDAGGEHIIYFNKVSETSIYCKVTVAKDNNFELTGLEDVNAAIVNKINSLINGQDVVLSSLYAPIMSVPGIVDVSSLTLSTDGATYNTNNIVISAGRTAKTSSEKVEVTVTDYVDQ